MTNVVEWPFAALRLRTDAAKPYRKVQNVTEAVWKMLMLAEQRFRRLDAPQKLELVCPGIGLHEIQEAKWVGILAIA